mmetsp:Transcript_16896/g.45790  ORF Transcript_16896/g.45790 Transcript_16896/m.45790 type:complete len:206 (+) Transcript_16896:82-699(+)
MSCCTEDPVQRKGKPRSSATHFVVRLLRANKAFPRPNGCDTRGRQQLLFLKRPKKIKYRHNRERNCLSEKKKPELPNPVSTTAVSQLLPGNRNAARMGSAAHPTAADICICQNGNGMRRTCIIMTCGFLPMGENIPVRRLSAAHWVCLGLCTRLEVESGSVASSPPTAVENGLKLPTHAASSFCFASCGQKGTSGMFPHRATPPH